MSGWKSAPESEDAMFRKPNRLLALALLCSIGQAGVSLADSPPFIGRLPQGTVDLIGVTNYPPTKQSRWWRADGSAAHMDSVASVKVRTLDFRVDLGTGGSSCLLP
jgi:hypothetical protein